MSLPITGPITFEESISIIDEEIRKCRGKWTLSAIQWMDYDDVSQIIRLHIYQKWHLWDQARPVRPWLHQTIKHQSINLVRNIYGSHSRPCLKCAAFEGETLCSIFTTQSSQCPLYAKWIKTKKSANDIKLPLSLEFHSNELSSRPDAHLDVDRILILLSERLKPILKNVEYKVYRMLYVEGREEDDVAKILKFKTSEVGRKKGYKQIGAIKKSIIEKASKLLYNGEIDF